MDLHGLILAGGRGSRAVTHLPKVMLPVGGATLVERNVTLLRDAFSVREVVVVVGHLAERVREHLGDGSRLGVRIRYATCDRPERGLGLGLLAAEPLLRRRPFATILGDEVYVGSNHEELARWRERDADAVVAVRESPDPEQVSANYAVELDGDRVTGLVEKPARPTTRTMGCGTYLLGPSIFDALRATPPSRRSGRLELTDALDRLARDTRNVYAFPLAGEYVNVNTREDHARARHLVRARQLEQARVSVVIPTFQEVETIGAVVADFAGRAEQVLVVDNASSDGTAEAARRAGAEVEEVRLGGYGDTIRHGLDKASGDVLVVVEADGSFRARDLPKLLEYTKDADLVVGTRTARPLNGAGTNMHGVVRAANIGAAKLMELLWMSAPVRLTDVGCTYRALWRDAYATLRPWLTGTGPEAAPEMIAAALISGLSVLEVPVGYHPRRGGESKHSADYAHLARTAMRMMRRVVALRATTWSGAPPTEPREGA